MLAGMFLQINNETCFSFLPGMWEGVITTWACPWRKHPWCAHQKTRKNKMVLVCFFFFLSLVFFLFFLECQDDPSVLGLFGRGITLDHFCTWSDRNRQQGITSSMSTQAVSFLYFWSIMNFISHFYAMTGIWTVKAERRFSMYCNVFSAFLSIGRLYFCDLVAKSGTWCA